MSWFVQRFALRRFLRFARSNVDLARISIRLGDELANSFGRNLPSFGKSVILLPLGNR
jgi:hypothetical protein